jgi:hypothetical protein
LNRGLRFFSGFGQSSCKAGGKEKNNERGRSPGVDRNIYSTPTVLDAVLIYNPILGVVIMPVILIPGILISLYFIWNARHINTA